MDLLASFNIEVTIASMHTSLQPPNTSEVGSTALPGAQGRRLRKATDQLTVPGIPFRLSEESGGEDKSSKIPGIKVVWNAHRANRHWSIAFSMMRTTSNVTLFPVQLENGSGKSLILLLTIVLTRIGSDGPPLNQPDNGKGQEGQHHETDRDRISGLNSKWQVDKGEIQ